MAGSLLPIFLGLFAGSAINYLADRLPRWRRLGPPLCPRCEQKQPWINYFLWPRRCPGCGHTHRWRSLAVDLTALGGSLWMWVVPPNRLGYLPGFVLLSFLILVVIIDLEHRLILHPVSFAGALLGLAVGSWSRGIPTTLIGGVAGFGTMLLLYSLGGVFTRWMSRLRGEEIDEVALGFGDVNLAGVLGLVLGWPGVMVGLLLAILLGGLISLLYLIAMLVIGRYRSFDAIPYAPFLVLGAALLVYFPQTARAILSGLSPILLAIFQ